MTQSLNASFIASFKDLELILIKLEISPIELVRTKEEIWKNNYKGQQITDDEIIKVLVENPKLIERPIVIKGNRAVIGRPPENVLSLLSQDGIWSGFNFPSLNQIKIMNGMTPAKKNIVQKAIKKTRTKIKKPRNFIIINFTANKQQQI